MLSLARALLNDNRLLLVDEPTKGLAPKIVTEVAEALEEAARTVPILLVEQNLPVIERLAEGAVVIDSGRVVHTGAGPRAARRPRGRPAAARRPRRDRRHGRRRGGRPHPRRPRRHRTGGREVSTIVLLLITGLGLGALYFLVASGLSLIYGLMGVLNFAHGSFLTLGAFAGWEVARRVGATTWTGFLLALLVGAVAGAAIAALTELLLIRPLYNRHIEQVLVTVGLGLATVALFEGVWGTDADLHLRPGLARRRPRRSLGARISNDRLPRRRRRRRRCSPRSCSSSSTPATA